MFLPPDSGILPGQQNMSCQPVYTAAVYTSNMTGKLHTAFIGTVCTEIHSPIIIKSALQTQRQTLLRINASDPYCT